MKTVTITINFDNGISITRTYGLPINVDWTREIEDLIKLIH